MYLLIQEIMVIINNVGDVIIIVIELIGETVGVFIDTINYLNIIWDINIIKYIKYQKQINKRNKGGGYFVYCNSMVNTHPAV